MLKLAACSSIECLEARIAPAAVFVNATTATYTDTDGDLVTVKFTKPILTSQNFTTVVQVTGTDLDLIDLSSVAAKAQGTGISVTVHASLAGNGLADVGAINAPGISLGTVSIAGDLGMITTAGGSNPNATPGVAKLSVYSMGRLEPQGGNGDLISSITGTLGSLTVTGVFNGEILTAGNIGPVTIGGSVFGGSINNSGSITSNGNIGALKIGGDLVGGMGTQSGEIYAAGTIASLTIGGSIIGGGGTYSGAIDAGSAVKAVVVGRDLLGGEGDSDGLIQGLSLGTVTIDGEVTGGDGDDSGEIASTNNGIGAVKIGLDLTGGAGSGNSNSGVVNSAAGITSVSIGGSVVGGTGINSGAILAEGGNIGAVSIGRDLIGGGADSTTSYSGMIWSETGSIAKITIGGSATGGQSPNLSGAIVAGVSLGPITIGGSVVGSSPTDPFIIQAAGSILPKASANLAISSVTVDGDFTNAEILAGFEVNPLGGAGSNSTPVSGHVQIGAVTVGGDWDASSISAGIAPDANGYFGAAGDAQNSGGPSNIVAKISSITIDGFVNGTATPTTDDFGFVANQIGSFKFAGVTVPLVAGKYAIIALSPATGDVTIEEIQP